MVLVLCVSRTVRIWDYTQDACINVLSGHTAPVRGLLWNTEVPYLLISGTELLGPALDQYWDQYWTSTTRWDLQNYLSISLASSCSL